jgi:hypothetical protein
LPTGVRGDDAFAGLPRGVTNVHGRQVFHLVFGEAEMDEKSPDLSHSADRDSHFLAAPRAPLLEEHMGYIVAARFHHQSLDLPYLSVARTDGQFAAYGYLAGWDDVDRDFLRGFRSARAAVTPGLGRTRHSKCSTSGGQRKKVHARGEWDCWGPLGSRSGTTSVSWAGGSAWNSARVQRSRI